MSVILYCFLPSAGALVVLGFWRQRRRASILPPGGPSRNSEQHQWKAMRSECRSLKLKSTLLLHYATALMINTHPGVMRTSVTSRTDHSRRGPASGNLDSRNSEGLRWAGRLGGGQQRDILMDQMPKVTELSMNRIMDAVLLGTWPKQGQGSAVACRKFGPGCICPGLNMLMGTATSEAFFALVFGR
ncbi:hypothetical protein GGX14DRAFT_396686 [Mycena pura]|uniref:Uncharacterized protein n=1 Tax=Mycena pura TaxID=153505 RepID=A0AAD6VA33_9AGAR|nr:hypothetical protein GGX14DRAFT_396686 [Mycena pura]